jgi:hypothetical protein
LDTQITDIEEKMKHIATSIGLTSDLLADEKDRLQSMQQDIVEWARKTKAYEI